MNQIIAAHICYLIADKNFDQYSDSARLCLVGGDHWKYPRTYASPEAIQVIFFVTVVYISSYWLEDSIFASPKILYASPRKFMADTILFVVTCLIFSLFVGWYLHGQRTELYEYSKTLGNSQFILLPFQPYKVIYAHMLAEVGKLSAAQK